MMTCRAIVLSELRLQQEAVEGIYQPHTGVVRLLSAALKTFYEIDRRAKHDAIYQELVEAQVLQDWVDLVG